MPQSIPPGFLGENGATAASPVEMGTETEDELAQVSCNVETFLSEENTRNIYPSLLAAPAFGGQHCSGSTKETEHCNTIPCPGEMLHVWNIIYGANNSAKVPTVTSSSLSL